MERKMRDTLSHSPFRLPPLNTAHDSATAEIPPNGQITYIINNVMPTTRTHLLYSLTLLVSWLAFVRFECRRSQRQESGHTIFRPATISPFVHFRTSTELMNVNRIQILCIARIDLLPGHFGHFSCHARRGRWTWYGPVKMPSFVFHCPLSNEEKGFHRFR